jgi:uncharacterized membrane protein YjjP (DUF1212 family)
MENFNKRLLLASIGFALLFMLLGSNGSFNPTKVGFYTSILAGILFYHLTNFGFAIFKSNKFKEKSPRPK